MNEPVTSISFFRLDGWRNRWWGFSQMQLARERLSKIPGATFVKLMGSGASSGFSWWPDFSVYSLFICWDSESSFREYLNNDEFYQNYQERSTEHFTALVQAYQHHGQWQGIDPLENQDGEKPDRDYVAVLTRASVRTSKLIRFWSLVPRISRRLEGQPGLLFSKGIGEWPIFELTTFSIWKSEKAMTEFAYGTPSHSKAVRATREKKLFSEELFARFKVLEIMGNWGGEKLAYGTAVSPDSLF